MKRLGLVLAAMGGLLLSAPTALADCVDFSQARAERAGAALERNAPSAAQLGVPSLSGLDLNGVRTTGDPQCDGGPPYTQFSYDTDMPFVDFVQSVYPNIKRRTTTDGMNREWFANPYHSDEVTLTSGTVLEIFLSGDRLRRVDIRPASVVEPLTTENQPYSVQDIAEGTPWPGGGDGPRAFVRADGGDSGYQAANNNSYSGATASAGASTPARNCPPASQSGAQTGASVGAEVGGAVLGGGFGRSTGRAAGAVLGGVFGSRNSGSSQPTQTQTPDCR